MKKLIIILIILLSFVLGLSSLIYDNSYRRAVRKYIPREVDILYLEYNRSTDIYTWYGTYFEKYSKTYRNFQISVRFPPGKYLDMIQEGKYHLTILIVIDLWYQRVGHYPILRSALFKNTIRIYEITKEQHKIRKDNFGN